MADLAWQLLRHGYDGVAREREARGGRDDFEARLPGRRAVVVRSPEGARTFYDESVVGRKSAVPLPLSALLFGPGAVHGLDPPGHRERKRMFLDVLGPERLLPLVEAVEAALEAQVADWPGGRVHVHDELVRAYGAGVLSWAGVPEAGHGADARSRQLAAIVDGFGGSGAAYARAWKARLGADRWAKGLVEDVRAGRLPVRGDCALAELAASGLDARTAGVELLNVLRPTVAVAWLGTFAALHLADWPDWRARLADPAGGEDRLAFAQEVRRTTPFVPALAARVHRRTELGGLVLRPGNRMVLDVLGIDHDPARWPDPRRFDPQRMLSAQPGAYDFVPQGGGHPTTGHRCPGESVALCLLDVTLRVLAQLDHDVESSHVRRSRIPTLPDRGLVVRVPALVRP